jgi:hypothetical protein
MLRADENAPRKQKYTIRRIRVRLADEHGFEANHSTLRDYVRRRRPGAGRRGRAPDRLGSAQRVHQGGDVGIQTLLNGSRRQLCPPCLPPWLRHQSHFL